MKKLLSLVAVMGLLSFGGCGGGDSDESTIADGSWRVRYSATVADLTLHRDADGNISGTLTPINGNGPIVTLSGWGDDTSMVLHGILSNDETLTLSGGVNGTNLTGSVEYKKVGYTPTTWELTGAGQWIPQAQPQSSDDQPADGLPSTGGKYVVFLDPNSASVGFVLGPDGRFMRNTLWESQGITMTVSQSGSQFTMTLRSHGIIYGTFEGTATSTSITGISHHWNSGKPDSGHSFNALPATTTSSPPYGWESN